MKVIATSYISAKGAFLNDTKVCSVEDANWLKVIYQSLELDYPKFYKMDNLSKMAFLGSEIMKNEIASVQQSDQDMQLLFANSASSQQTDLKYIESYSNEGNPSPSLFVYTLPNIVTGELAIRNKWFGENTFFITEKFDENFFKDQLQFAFTRGNNVVLCAWVDTPKDGIEECFLFLVSEDENPSKNLELLNRLNNYRNE